MTFYCNGKPLGMVDDVELEDVELEGIDIANAKVWKDETFTAEVDTSGWSKEQWQAILGLIPIIRCKDCKHFVEDVWAVIDGLPVIVCHEACYRWSKDGNKVGAEGFCCLAERREE